ncbi:ABC transporter permease [Humibacter ginsenosidimutans]|uniref:ABC transporter permease n=1 Tax=Humibacter ginsenosidimutans TaxID=2599293 RepID=A0A5B8M3X3_9MICO|nr:ABC transporter permease [Humibacter ginsenosidimutans]QDZ14634.1 ABC transporter permease [Humibacter ginsenosidimutans]
MAVYILRRVLSGLVLIVVVGSAAFFLAHLAIPDPSATLIGKTATPEQIHAERELLGLNQPLMTQYWNWLSGLLRGDFGISWRTNTPLNADLGMRIPVTLSVVTFGMLLTAVFGGIIGTVAGLRPGGVVDKITQAASVVLFAIPGYWISIVLVIVFAVNLRWFPALGYVRPDASVSGWMLSITLPAISLALGGIVMIAAQLRNSIVGAGSSDFVRTLRSRGLSTYRVALHLVRNAAPAAVTVLALMFVSLLGGVIILEKIFNLPGLGIATQQASQVGDIPELLAITVTTVIFVVVVNLLLDLVLGWINPKARIR